MKKVGGLDMYVYDKLGAGGETVLNIETHTATNLSKPLFSVASLYEGGDWDMLLRGDNRGGPCLMHYDKNSRPTNEVPLRWDYGDHCPYLDHSLHGSTSAERPASNPRKRNERLVNTVNCLPTRSEILNELGRSKNVDCLFHINDIDEINTSGAKRGMRTNVKR